MAGNLIELRRRIRSVRNTQKLTKAMKTVSAAKLRRASGDLKKSGPYADKLAGLLAALAPRLETAHPLIAPRPPGKRLLVVVAADKGLCGAFNSRLLKRAEERLQELAGRGEGDVRLVAVGTKAWRYFAKRHPARIDRHYAGVMGRLTFADARGLADDLLAAWRGETLHAIEFVFTEYLSASRQAVTVQPLLPAAPDVAPGAAAPDADLILEPSAAAMVEALLPLWLRARVYRFLLHSVAAEQGARMVAMDLATRNASDMIRSLTLTMNKLRQASITKELLEIMTATEALKK